MRHIISILLENEAGALSRVSGLFSARGYNIESLTVAPTEDPSLSRMTIVTSGSGDVIEQITKQLNKLVEVVKVVDLFETPHIERELMLIKVRAGAKERDDMKRMSDIFRGRIIDVSEDTFTIELTGTGQKLDAFIEAVGRSAILETARTLININSRSMCGDSNKSTTLTTSTSLFSCLVICSITSPEPDVTMVMRDSDGSSVGATVSDSML